MREKPLILLVDDEDNFLEIIGTKLKASGFDIEIAHNGTEAIQKSAQVLPDLILMDIHMPGMTGTDAALAIKQNDKTKDVKIAFLTSMNDPWPGLAGDRVEESKEMGMADFLKKDDDLDKIVEKVKSLLASSPAVSPTPEAPAASSDGGISSAAPTVAPGNPTPPSPAGDSKDLHV